MKNIDNIKTGKWYIKSMSDPRWNASGEGNITGHICMEAGTELKKLKEKYGKQPDDLIIRLE